MLSQDYKLAKSILNQSIRKAEGSLGKKALLTLRLYELYGICLREEGDYKRALKTYEKISKLREKAQGFGNKETVACYYVKASILVKLSRNT